MPKERIHSSDLRYPDVTVNWGRGEGFATVRLHTEHTILDENQLDRLASILKRARRQVDEPRLPDLYLFANAGETFQKGWVRDLAVCVSNVYALEGLTIRDAYVTRKAVAHPDFPKANDIVRRTFAKTPGAHALHIID
ncbi:hypothetical protein HUO13_12145 [Saccharopolyspora erythraea]|uniref:hypothetical protein n=1 Tax=Saccharopolyspora erythraea TaxID=1836 RepID=UPI001BA7F19E|nr:hypothetical protein [Saccharopolyspora erythraea]QUH01464.1 hypothetical protein HUO13_12145 [Saccharopolyspora erythraea]